MTTTESDPQPPAALPHPNPTSSFWHSEPNLYLLGHRTTSDLPAEADVVIVGSGITGTSAARWLDEDERFKGSVVMLEAREACWGATGRNGGHCQPLLFDRGPDVAAFEIKNYETVKSYIETHSVQCEWRAAVSCRSFCSPAFYEAAVEEVEHLRKASPELASKVECVSDADFLKEKYNVIEEEGTGASITQDAASLWPYKYVTFVIEKLIQEKKLNLQTKTPATRIESQPDGRTKIVTDRGIIIAKHLILATNAYTSHLVPSFSDLIVPVRGTMTALVPPASMKERLPASYGFVGAMGQAANMDDYLIQRPFKDVPNPAGHLMFGGGGGFGSRQRIGTADDSVLDEGSAAFLRGALLKLMSLGDGKDGQRELEAAGQWTGIMGYSRDNHPWVGEIPDFPNVWLCAGYTGHGMPNGTLCAKAAVEMMLGKENNVSAKETALKLAKTDDLPKEYFITKERIQAARTFATVAKQDELGLIGEQSKGFLEEAKAKKEGKKGMGCVIA